MSAASPEEAATKLAQLQQLGQRLRGHRKQAAPDFLGRVQELVQQHPQLATLVSRIQSGGQRALDWAQTNPGAATALGGAGLGAVAGGLSTLGRPKRERRPFRNMLTGALAGGALGGGAALAAKNLPSSQPPRLPDGQALPSPAEISRLGQRSLPSRALEGGQNFVRDYAQNHPYLATLLGLDIGTQILGTGSALTGTPSTQLGHINRGIDRMLAQGGLAPELEGSLKQIRHNKELARTVFRRLRTGNNFTMPAGQAGGQPFVFKPSLGAEITNELGGGMVRRGGIGALADLFRFGSRGPRQGFGTGLSPQGNTLAPAPRGGFLSRLLSRGRYAADTATRLAGEADFPWRPASRTGQALLRGGPRAGLYLGIPALQHYLGVAQQESANAQRLRALAEQLQAQSQ